MQFDDLRLPSGARMKLTISGVAMQNSIQARFVGMHAPRSIIAAVPAATFNADLEAGARVGVSMVTATDIVTFATAIESCSATPFPHVFLSYPETISARKVRSAARVNVGVSAQVANLSAEDPMEMHAAQIIDISVSGLKLASAEVLGGLGDELALHVHLNFDTIARDIVLTGNIRSQNVASETDNPLAQICGVEFTEMSENKRVLLYAFVFCMIQQFGPQM